MSLVSDPNVAPLPTASAAPVPTPTPTPTPSPTSKPTPKPTPATVAVPNVVGDAEADALVQIGAAGLTAGAKTRKYDPKVPAGDVLSTDPKPGVIVQRGTAIDYKVSRGPEPTPSPTPKPTPKPTAKPTPKPTPNPTPKPTPKPTAKPTPKPTSKPTSAPSDALSATSWILARYDDGNGEVIDVPVVPETPTAAFASGTISGFAGCNTYTASYKLDGSTITFGTPSVTRKQCGDLATAVEANFLAAMGQVTTWKLSTDSAKLTLSGKDGHRS